MTYEETRPIENPGASEAGVEAAPGRPLLVPLPTALTSASQYPAPFRVLVPDEGSIVRLLEDLLNNSGMSLRQAAKCMGVSDENIRQYTKGRRSNPGVLWLVKFANLCGFEVVIRRKKQ